MFTMWHQVEDWINDNNIKKWVFTKNNPLNRAKGEIADDRIVDSTSFDKNAEEKMDFSRKIELTKKYLEQFGERCYGQGYTSEQGTKGAMFCEVCLSSDRVQQPVGVMPQMPMGTGSFDEAALTERIKNEIRLEYDKRDFERDKKNLEKERREFEADKASAMGAIVGILRPYLPALKNVAGLQGLGKGKPISAPVDDPDGGDAPEHHAPEPDAPDPENPEEENQFTDEEVAKIEELLGRFKKVEPQYLELLESVVKMAESGDTMYATAKGFLLK